MYFIFGWNKQRSKRSIAGELDRVSCNRGFTPFNTNARTVGYFNFAIPDRERLFHNTLGPVLPLEPVCSFGNSHQMGRAKTSLTHERRFRGSNAYECTAQFSNGAFALKCNKQQFGGSMMRGDTVRTIFSPAGYSLTEAVRQITRIHLSEQ